MAGVIERIMVAAGIGDARLAGSYDQIEAAASRHERRLAPILASDLDDEEKATHVSRYLSAGVIGTMLDDLARAATNPRLRAMFQAAKSVLSQAQVRKGVLSALALGFVLYALGQFALVAVVIGVVIGALISLVIDRATSDAVESRW